jgi:hypothetical protein
MKPGYFLIPVLLIALTVTFIEFGCSKSSGGNCKPKMSLQSVNTTVQPNDSMIAMFKFSGCTASNGTFVSIRVRLNQAPVTQMVGPDTIYNPIPSYSASSGQYRYVLDWDDYLSETANQNDTMVFKFFVLSADSISSDTITSPQIVIMYQ